MLRLWESDKSRWEKKEKNDVYILFQMQPNIIDKKDAPPMLLFELLK